MASVRRSNLPKILENERYQVRELLALIEAYDLHMDA
jgi:hypothetical protein